MNLTSMVTQAQEYLDDPNGRVWTSARLTRLLNLAQAWIVNMIEQEDENYFLTSESVSVTYTSGDDNGFSQSLPSDFRKAVCFERWTSNTYEGKIPVVDFRDRFNGDATLHLDDQYVIGPRAIVQATTLRVVGHSDAFTMKHWYLPRLSDMSGTGTSTVPAEFHDLIIVRAVYLAKTSVEQDIQIINNWKETMMELAQQCKNSLSPRQTQISRQVI